MRKTQRPERWEQIPVVRNSKSKQTCQICLAGNGGSLARAVRCILFLIKLCCAHVAALCKNVLSVHQTLKHFALPYAWKINEPVGRSGAAWRLAAVWSVFLSTSVDVGLGKHAAKMMFSLPFCQSDTLSVRHPMYFFPFYLMLNIDGAQISISPT